MTEGGGGGGGEDSGGGSDGSGIVGSDGDSGCGGGSGGGSSCGCPGDSNWPRECEVGCSVQLVASVAGRFTSILSKEVVVPADGYVKSSIKFPLPSLSPISSPFSFKLPQLESKTVPVYSGYFWMKRSALLAIAANLFGSKSVFPRIASSLWFVASSKNFQSARSVVVPLLLYISIHSVSLGSNAPISVMIIGGSSTVCEKIFKG